MKRKAHTRAAVILITVLLCLSNITAVFAADDIQPVTSETIVGAKKQEAEGSLLTLVPGLNIDQIKNISMFNLLPSLILVWPWTWLFSLFMQIYRYRKDVF